MDEFSRAPNMVADEARLAKLRSLNLLDTEDEPAFDRLTRLASDILDVPVSLVSLVDVNRQFFKSQIGLQEPWSIKRETPLSHSFCQHVVNSGKDLIVDDARQNSLLADNLAINDLGVIAYAGIPLMTSDGYILGSFCAIDGQEKHWTERDIRILRDLAASVMTEIELRAELVERQKVEQDLRNTETKFRNVMETATDAIIILNEESRIEYCNPATTTIFGYSIQELLGESLDLLTPASEQQEFQIVLSQHIFHRRNEWQAIRLEGRHKDGYKIAIEAAFGTFLQDGDTFLSLIIRDISMRVEMEIALRESEERYLQILDSIPDIIFVKDRQSNLIWANKALLDYYDTSLIDLQGSHDTVYTDEDLSEQYAEGDMQVFNTGEAVFIREEPIVKHDGTVNIFSTAKTPIFDHRGEVVMVVGIARDISQRKQMEEDLKQALIQERELAKLKSGFVSTVSHEFRTPLAVIMSSTSMLTDYFDKISPERRATKLKTIKAQVMRLTRLMDDILLFSRADEVGLRFHPKLHDVNALMATIIEDVQVSYKDNIQIQFDTCEVGSQYIDEDLIRHIFQNLLTNAIKYSHPDSIVKARLDCQPDALIITVQDHGIGIPLENQKNLFKSFHRADNVGTIQGTGLGLSIVKHAVEAHGGTIDFTSIEGEGTTFVVKLPTSPPIQED